MTMRPDKRDDQREAREGYSMRDGVKVYCCYGTYCDIGHSPECKHAIKGSVPSTGGKGDSHG